MQGMWNKVINSTFVFKVALTHKDTRKELKEEFGHKQNIPNVLLASVKPLCSAGSLEKDLTATSLGLNVIKS